jgi:hypothetical protein
MYCYTVTSSSNRLTSFSYELHQVGYHWKCNEYHHYYLSIYVLQSELRPHTALGQSQRYYLLRYRIGSHSSN